MPKKPKNMTELSTMSKNLRINGLVEESITDGPGIRFTVFTQGCPHACPGCHNPETHPFDGGYELSCQGLLEKITVNPLIFGVTFSGGDPMCQPEPVAELAAMLRQRGYSIALYTGYTWEQLLAEADPWRMNLLALCDVVIDGPFLQTQKSLLLRFRGSANQRIIDVAKSLKAGQCVLSQDPAWAAQDMG